MKDFKLIEKYTKNQYKNHEKLGDRINLWSFGTNPIPLQEWIFKRTAPQENEFILELGGGTGKLWSENYSKLNSFYKIIFSDFSKNMLIEAEKNLRPLKLNMDFQLINAEDIPYADESFDIVLGCHMLYHVPDIKIALKEINRVMKSNGRFISTTTSQHHIKELIDFLESFGLSFEEKTKFFSEFRNETGKSVLRPFFRNVEFHEYINPVEITEVPPLMKYIESMFQSEFYPHFQEIKPKIKNSITKILEEKKKFTITGITGLFIARKND